MYLKLTPEMEAGLKAGGTVMLRMVGRDVRVAITTSEANAQVTGMVTLANEELRRGQLPPISGAPDGYYDNPPPPIGGKPPPPPPPPKRK